MAEANNERVLIIGGVAGGASAAARLRRLDESCEIIIFDRGHFVSFANCGLPYYVGDVIKDEADLIVASPELFKSRFDIEVRTRHEVTHIDREARQIEVRALDDGRVYTERYDKLVLSPGARPVRPPLPGIDLPGIFVLRTIPDSREIRDWVEARGAERAVVVGAGFIGLEMAENLRRRGLQVTVLEMLDQVMPPLDVEMARPVEDHLREHGVELVLGDAVAGFVERDGALEVRTQSGATIAADLVILGIGVRPETTLAEACGLETGARGGIVVDATMRTSDPDIWAVGDAVEVPDVITGEMTCLALAGPANREGRVAADSMCGRDTTFRGVQATSVCGVFDLVVAATGASEKSLARACLEDYQVIYLHPGHHVGYYPGSRPIHIKLIFSRPDGRVLGVQAVGEKGVERRVDVVAMAIQMGATVFDLEQAELCYAPQFGAAKDPVNLAGMIAANVLRGDHPIVHWSEQRPDDVFLLDVRSTSEFARGGVDGAVNIPLSQLRARLDEIPEDRDIWVYCAVGQRAYYATRALLQHGRRVRNLSGGIASWGVRGH
ncbi:MAG: FAD-dependent oxidoreductase [Acidobacteriota bacterium]